MLAELAGNAALLLFAFGLTDIAWLRYHVMAMAIGQCLTAFFAVWTVHHDCPPGSSGGSMARTMRGRFEEFLTYNMFLHVEHHLFPAVPTCKLGILARRLDAVAPGFSEMRIL